MAGLVFDVADVANAFVYALEKDWVHAGMSIACSLPFLGTVVSGVSKFTKFAKVGDVIGKSIKLAGRAYMTAASASTALELAGDAKMERAINGGKSTVGSVLKIIGATAMAGIAVLTGGKLMDEAKSVTKALDVAFTTRSKDMADAVSGKCCKGSGIGCFVAGTKVLTVDGEKNIEDVKAGDYVLSKDEKTGEQGYKKVTKTFIHIKETIVHVYVGNEEIETTVEHPFYVEEIGFVSAGELKVGDVIQLADGRTLPIEKIEIEELDEPLPVYNFEVEDYHTYYVSELGVWVHNDCPETEGGTSSVKTDFYVTPSGDVVPATGYRYMDSKYAE